MENILDAHHKEFLELLGPKLWTLVLQQHGIHLSGLSAVPLDKLPVVQKVQYQKPSFFPVPQSARVLLNLASYRYCLVKELIKQTKLDEVVHPAKLSLGLTHRDELVYDSLLLDLLHRIDVNLDCLASIAKPLHEKRFATVVSHETASFHAFLQWEEVVGHPAFNCIRLQLAKSACKNDQKTLVNVDNFLEFGVGLLLTQCDNGLLYVSIFVNNPGLEELKLLLW